MGYLFRQVWLWCLLSFLLGSLMTWLIMRATRRPKVEVTEERIQGPSLTERPTRSPMATDTSAPPRSGVDTGRTSAMDLDSRQATGAAAAGATVAGAAATGRSMTPPSEKASLNDSTMRIVEPGPYPGSARPNADGSPPSREYLVKGNMNSMLYHTTESPSYRETRAEIWFRTPAEAESAGFTAWNRNPKQARR
ncbi:sunset domain-containing protein [Catelliglobosispora koreensis]|uniref:sunset domain-containing protein n=1 Tax=Catelliglobosispora koreensis TaxID=129052 RepID=UPI000689055E|nr:hypothetical protein [Catelliglobosispora koreensis]